MALEPVHVMEMDRSTSRLELKAINPTRQFVIGTPQGMGLYTWQCGVWYDTGGNEVPEAEVPQQFRDEIVANPVTVTSTGPKVNWTCPICRDTMNASEMEPHMLEHVNDTMRLAGSTTAANTHAAPPPPPAPEESRKRREVA